jgi:hypothetical protein
MSTPASTRWPFAAGIAFNLASTLVVAMLMFRQSGVGSPLLAQA